jgi:hypothetical protein
MARTAVQRSIPFDPSFRLTDFLGVGSSTKGAALAPLNSLLPIYPVAQSFSWLFSNKKFLPELKDLATLMLIRTNLPSW